MNGFLASQLFENQTTPPAAGDPAPDPEERPEWLLEKFKTPEEQGRAYAEAEKRMAQLQSQLDQERQQFAETIQSIQATVSPEDKPVPLEQDPIILQYEKAVEDGDARAMLAIQLQLQQRMLEQTLETKMKPVTESIGQVTQQERENAIMLATERVKQEFGDEWDGLAPKIGAVLQERQHWIPQGASVDAFATTLREVAGLVKSQEIIAQQQKDEADRIAKLSAQGLEGVGSRQLTPEEQKAEWQRIKDAPLGGYAGIIGGAR